ncbi:hypothetical protein V6758_14395 [Corynebacterium kalidii]
MPTPADPPEWRRYFYPGSEVLRNKLDIRDAAELQRLEYDVTQQQAASLDDGDLPIEGTTSAERLSFIHKSLLGSIYEWAGEYRDVNITKGVMVSVIMPAWACTCASLTGRSAGSIGRPPPTIRRSITWVSCTRT